MPENDSDEYDEYDSSDYESETPLSEEIEPNSEYLEPYLIPPSLQLYATFGCMILSKKVDMFSPFVVKLIRYVPHHELGFLILSPLILFVVSSGLHLSPRSYYR